MAPGTKNTKHKIAEITTSILTDEVSGDVASFIRSLAYKRFAPDLTLEKRVLLHEAVRQYLASGRTEDASRVVSEGISSDVMTAELVNLVSESDAFDAITEKVRNVIEAAAPGMRIGDRKSVV